MEHTDTAAQFRQIANPYRVRVERDRIIRGTSSQPWPPAVTADGSTETSDAEQAS
ncbi:MULTISPECIES: hypothetical protein [Prauserella]|uniref:hypothetical protein n=1 Tax=Prauserella TaxID=142577 RepID=UPI0013054090|nr:MULTISPECIES: hypothetical protein [Prauserella]